MSVGRACQVAAWLVVLLQSHAASGALSNTGADQRALSHTCQVVIQGSPGGAATLHQAFIHCWTPDGAEGGCNAHLAPPSPAQSQEPLQQLLPADAASKPLTVWVGAALYEALSSDASPRGTGGPQPSTCGVELRLRPSNTSSSNNSNSRSGSSPASDAPRDDASPPPPTGFEGSFATAPPGSDSSGGGGDSPDDPTTSIPDWGVTFLGVPHLRLVDSVLADLPLSAAGPLLLCADCQHLTITNLTMQRLSGPPLQQAGRTPVYGALAASGVRDVVASQVECSGVTLAHGWACMLLQYGDTRGNSSWGGGGAGGGGGESSFVLDGGTFVGNSVVLAGPGAEGPRGLGLGALVLGAEAVAPPDGSAGSATSAPAEEATSSGFTGAGDTPPSEGPQSPPGAGPASSTGPSPPRPLLSRVELRGVVAEGNSGGSGAVLAVLDADVASLRLVDSTLTYNSAYLTGGAVYVGVSRSDTMGARGMQAHTGSSSLQDLHMHNTTLEGNAAFWGGAVGIAESAGRLAAANCRITQNYADEWYTYVEHVLSDAPSFPGGFERGGAVWLGGSLTSLQLLDGTVVQGNSVALSGSGSFVYALGNVTSVELQGASMVQNGPDPAWSGLRAVYVDGAMGRVLVRNSIVSKNYGGAFMATPISLITVDNSSITSNQMSAFISDGPVREVVVTNHSTVSHNLAYDMYAYGAFLIASSVGRLVILNGSSVENNTALDVPGTGGAVYTEGRIGYLEVSGNSSLSYNRARGSGGAVAARSIGLVVVSDGAAVCGNVAGETYIPTFQSFAVVHQHFPYVQANGGAFYAEHIVDRLVLSNGARMEGNQASQDGGAVFARTVRGLELRSAILRNNTARLGGGGAIASDARSPEAVNDSQEEWCEGINSTRVSWWLEDSLVSGNTAGSGHGGALLLSLGFVCWYGQLLDRVYTQQPSACVSISNSRLEGNSAAGAGGALAVHNPYYLADSDVLQRTAPARVSLYNATFQGNRAGRDSSSEAVDANSRLLQSGLGGALYLHVPPAWSSETRGWSTDNCVLDVGGGTVFAGNAASDMGGAAALVWCAARLGGGTRLEGNSAGSSGGGLALLQELAAAYAARVVLDQAGAEAAAGNNTVATCVPSVEEGVSPPAWLAVRNASFERNTARVAGGALFAQSVFSVGNVTGSVSPTLIALGSDTTLVRNSAVRGGGLFAQLQGSTAVVDGGCLVEENDANTGGGAYLVISRAGEDADDGNDSSSSNRREVVQVGRSRWERNAALVDGGGLYIQVPAPAQPPASGAAAGGSAPSTVSLRDVWAAGNTAGGAGGALCVATDHAASPQGDPAFLPSTGLGADYASSDPAAVRVESCALEGNSAGSAGGGLWIGPGASVTLRNTSVRGNTAAEGPGGGVAADGCAWLGLLGGGEVAGNAALRSTGGGVFAGGCGRVLLQGVAVRGNRALAGGGLHLDGGGGDGPSNIDSGSLAVVANATLHSNAAELLSGSSSASNSNSSNGDGGGTLWVGGRGGALYVSGRVAAVVTDSDLSEGNTGVFGWGIATTQTCAAGAPPPPAPGPVPGASGGGLTGPAGEALVPASPAWSSLAHAARSGCWLLALAGDTRLPLAAAAGGAAAGQQVDGGTGQQQQQVGVRVWSPDPSLPALYAACSGGSPATGVDIIRNGLAPGGSRDAGDLYGALADTYGMTGVVAEALAQLQQLHASYPAALTKALAGNASNAGTASRLETLRSCLPDSPLLEPLGPSASGSTNTTSGTTYRQSDRDANLASVFPSCLGATLFRQQLVVVRPGAGGAGGATSSSSSSSMGAGVLADGCGNGSVLLLRPGLAFELHVQLYDSTGEPLRADPDVFNVQLDLQPAFLGPALQPGAPTAFAVLDSGLATAAAGQAGGGDATGSGRGSLAQRVWGGAAAWGQVVARGWPGEYRLVASVESATGVYKVPPLSLPVRLLPCSVGDSLLPGWGPDLPGGQPAWTSCQACGADQVGLWRDGRQQLQPGLELAGITSDQLNATVQELLDRTGGSSNGAEAGTATCRNCPAGAQCPGAAVLVPRSGWWHSAANSTAFHRCPFPAACGAKGGSEALWNGRLSANGTGVPTTLSQSDPRSRALAACQAAWYASGWRPGLGVVAEAAVQGMLGPTAAAIVGVNISGGDGGGNLPCLLWYEPILLADSAVAANGDRTVRPRARRVLQAGAQQASSDRNEARYMDSQPVRQAWEALSYTQLQCAEGYTGNLCAACQPGHYLQPGFECEECPGVGRTVLLGTLAFVGSVGLVLFTAAVNLAQDEADSEQEAAPAADVVKIAILYIQYAVVVLRLNIDYPSSITAVAAAASSLTWAGSLLGFSPACLMSGLDSGGQATAQLLGSLLIPCAIVVASLGLWAIRYAAMHYYRRRRYSTTLGSFASFTRTPYSLRSASGSGALAGAAVASAEPSPAPATADRTPADPALDTSPSTRVGADVSSAAERPAATSTDLVGASAVQLAAAGADNAAATGAGPQPCVDTRTSGGRVGGSGGGGEAAAWALTSSSLRRPAGAGAPGQRQTSRGRAHGGGQAEPPSLPAADAPGSVLELRLSKSISSSDTSSWADPLNGPEAAPMASATSLISSAAVRARRYLSRRISRGTTALALADRALPLGHQLGVVLLIGVFVLYPSWVQAALGVFACYVVDRDAGTSYPENQRATWRYGYWERDMAQQCYAGRHLHVFVPIGIASIIVFCFAPPLASFLLLCTVRWKRELHSQQASGGGLVARCRGWLKRSNSNRRGTLLGIRRDALQDEDVVRRYGFLYSRYRPRYWWWESVLLLQTLALVAAEVFGRTLPVERQALLLAAVLLVIAFVNTVCVPVRCRRLVVLEYTCTCALLLTLTLGVYLMGGSLMEGADGDAVGAAILAVNAAALLALAYPLAAPRIAKLARAIAKAVRRCWSSGIVSGSCFLQRASQGGCGRGAPSAAGALLRATRRALRSGWQWCWQRGSRGSSLPQGGTAMAGAEGASGSVVAGDAVQSVPSMAAGGAVVVAMATAFDVGGMGDGSAVLDLRPQDELAAPQGQGPGGGALTLHGCPSGRHAGGGLAGAAAAQPVGQALG